MDSMDHSNEFKLLYHVFSRAKFYIAIGALIGFILAVLFVWLSVPQYRASMVVAPANPMNGAEMSSLMANDDLFALRYMMQRVGVSGSSDFTRFETMVDGQAAATLLLQSERVREGLKNVQMYKFQASKTTWTAAELSKYLSDAIVIDPVGATSLRRIYFSHPDPDFAVDFLTLLHGVTDGLIRRNIRDGAEQRVTYLKQAVSEAVNPDHRRVLTSLLMEQERLKMLVAMDNDYAATLIEPPSVEHKPKFPNKALIFVVFMLTGMVFGHIVYLMRHD